jgi:D-alanine-D-alanine ligase
MNKTVIGLFFGGRSAEHEVSVISALQAYKHLNLSKYEVVPIYISKQGEFFTNPKFLEIKSYKDVNSLLFSSAQIALAKKNGKPGFIRHGLFKKFTELDVALPILHGATGEDGSIQGLFEMYQLPYAGLNVTGSAVAMDKAQSKLLFKSLGYGVANYIEIKRLDWWKDQKSAIKDVKKELKAPWFVKPATGGSSIGAGLANNEDELQFAIEVASIYSEKIIIEEAFNNCIEVNCAAVGYEDIKASVCEMPVPSKDILSFADKYQRGGKGSKGAGGMESLTREIPAPLTKELTHQIQEATIKIFKAMDGCGVARIDFFVDQKKNKFWVNEVNSPPGSLAFYLWEKSDPKISYTELLDQLISDAIKRAENNKKTQYIFESGLLSQMAKAAK